MADDWIKMRTRLRDDPAVILISQALKMSRDEVVGKLHAVWSWATDHLLDGRADVPLLSHIDDVADAQGFAQAMVAVGWLVANSESIAFPKWDRHLSEGAKQRALATEKKRKQRAKKCPDFVPILSPQIGDQRREEKRREYKKEELASSASEKRPDSVPILSPQNGDKKREPASSSVAAFERRLGRVATSSEVMNLHRIREGLVNEPVVIEGVAQDPDEFLILCLGQLPPDVEIPHRYLASVIDRCRRDGVKPGSSTATKSAPDVAAISKRLYELSTRKGA